MNQILLSERALDAVVRALTLKSGATARDKLFIEPCVPEWVDKRRAGVELVKSVLDEGEAPCGQFAH